MEATRQKKVLFQAGYSLPLIIFAEGFTSVSVEILTIRQLLPVVGGSVIVTSFVIGVFILFLVLGYQQGAKTSANLPLRLRKNFLIASIWLGIGLSYYFVSIFFDSLQKIAGPHIIYPLVCYLFVVIGPLVYILGQAIALSMNMIAEDQFTRQMALLLGTIGSFLGAILTTLIMLHFFGVAWAIFFNVLLLVGMFLLLSDDQTSWLELILSLFFLMISFACNVSVEKALFSLTNHYANYRMINMENSQHTGDEKILVINEGLSSFKDGTGKGFPYIEMIKKILFYDLKLRGEEILVLGAGGGSLSAENSFDNHFTYVDIDKTVKQFAMPQFTQHAEEKLIIDDARHFLQTNRGSFAAIVTDVYSDIKAIPAHLLTREYMQAVKAKLKPHGYAIFNIIANPMLNDAYSHRIDNTIRSVFTACVVIPHLYADRPTNIIYACKNSSGNDKMVYSDNLNRSTIDSFFW